MLVYLKVIIAYINTIAFRLLTRSGLRTLRLLNRTFSTRFGEKLPLIFLIRGIVYFLVVNNKYSSHVGYNMIFEISAPDYFVTTFLE